jgi:DNA repair exonuclease SbcCD ATPase subunit
MRAYRLYLTIGVAVLLLPGVALPQSLGDLARKTEEQRQKSKPPSKVYTNEDLKRDPGSTTVSAPGSNVPPTPDAKPNTSPSTSTDTPKVDVKNSPAPQEPPKDQRYWKDRMTEARTQLTRSKLVLDALQTRLNSLSTDIVNRDDPAQRAVLERDRQDTLREMERLKKDIQDQTKTISDIEEEARRARVPPGWLR